MSKHKHTPGPWKVTKHTTPKRRYFSLRIESADLLASGIIATVHAAFLKGEADARLIASAPDLLIRLKVALDWMDEARLVPSVIPEDVRQGIADAIAKAEGRDE